MKEKQFDFKNEQKVQKAINKIFIIQDENNMTDEQIITSGQIAIMDPAGICMLVAKSIQAKIAIKRFTNTEIINTVPDMDYNKNSKGAICKYSTLYLIRILQIVDCVFESVTVSINEEYPATFENEHFKIIVAPKVETR